MRKFLNPCVVITIGLLVFGLSNSDGQEANKSPGLPSTTELIPWTVGSDLTLIVGLHANGKSTPHSDYKYQRVKTILKYLDLEMPQLPESDMERAKESAQALHLLMSEFGKDVTQALQKKYDAKHGHLLEVAIKSGSLLILYEPGDEMGLTIARVIENRAGKAELPEKLWNPLVERIKSKAPTQEVIKAVLEFQGTVEMHLEENGTPMPGRELLTAYELGFHWGMVADAFIYKSDLIRAEFLPRAERNAKALGIDLSQHRMKVGVLGRKDNAEGRRWEADNRQRTIKEAVEKKVGSAGAALFQLGSELQLRREDYDPDAVVLTQYSVESGNVYLRKLASAADLPESVFDPFDRISKKLVSKDEFNKTVFRINGEILNILRRRSVSNRNDSPTNQVDAPKSSLAELTDMELMAMAAELTNEGEKPAPHPGLSVPVHVPYVTQQQIKSALELHKAFGKKIPQTTDEFMREIVDKQILQLPLLPSGKRFKWDPFLEQLTIEDDR